MLRKRRNLCTKKIANCINQRILLECFLRKNNYPGLFTLSLFSFNPDWETQKKNQFLFANMNKIKGY